MDTHTANFAIGLIAVVWLAARRFDTPRPVWTYTRALPYFWGGAAYVLVGVACYAFLFSLLASVIGLEETAALAALVLTGLAIRFPGAAAVDRWFRAELHRLIGYPSEARRLASAISVAPFVPTAAVREEVRCVLQGRGYDLDNGWLPVAEPMRELWFRAAALFHQVHRWDRDPRFGRFASAARDELDVLRQRFDQLSLKVVRVLETIEELGRLWIQCDTKPGSAAGAPKLNPADTVHQQFRTDLRAVVNRLLADLREDVAFFYGNLCLFVARGILAECALVRSRQRELARLGFKIVLERRKTMLVLAAVFAFYFGAFLLAVAYKVSLPEALPLNELVRAVAERVPLITKIALIHALAVAVAVVPKQLFGFANENLFGRTPRGFVLSAGLVAVGVALLVHIAFAALSPNGRSVAETLTRVAPWLVMPFATAASVAYLVQDGRWARIASATGRRLADVLFLVCALGLAICAARGMHSFLREAPWTLETVGRDAWLITVIGVGIGYMIPNAFRHPTARGVSRPKRIPAAAAYAARGRVRPRIQLRLPPADAAVGPTRDAS